MLRRVLGERHVRRQLTASDSPGAEPDRRQARTWPPLLLAALTAVVAALVLTATWHSPPFSRNVWVTLQLTGVSFAVSGAVLWRTRPEIGIGRLMVLCGLTWYIGDLQLIDQPVVFAVGFCFYYTSSAVLAHLVIALPAGRLQQRHERVLVVTQYVAAPALQIVRLIVEYPPKPQGWGDPAQAQSVWAAVGSVALLILTVLTAGVIARRWIRAGRGVRRTYALVWSSILALGLLRLLYAAAALVAAGLVTQRHLLLANAVGLLLIPVTIAVGMIRARLARVRVAELVTALREVATPADLQALLRRALDDPDLRIYYPVGEQNADPQFVDGDGIPAQVPTSQDGAVTVDDQKGRTLAVLILSPAADRDPELVAAVAAVTRLAVENARLHARQQAQLVELQSSRARLVLAGDEERHRLQRDLHDGVQHRLLAVSMHIDRARTAGQGDRTEQPGAPLAAAAAELREVIRDLRRLAEGIHPPVLREQGLAAAIEVLAERAPMPVTLRALDRRWPEQVERTAYFVVTEALANAYKYADAAGIFVRVDGDDRRLIVSVRDDGVGGIRESIWEVANPVGGASGLRGLRDRVAALGGTLGVHSRAGVGTEIVARLPCVW